MGTIITWYMSQVQFGTKGKIKTTVAYIENNSRIRKSGSHVIHLKTGEGRTMACSRFMLKRD